MPVIRTALTAGRFKENPPNNYLWKHRKNIYSQAGEDGVIAEILRKIGSTNKWCVEFGAWDGVHISNVCHLIRTDGWSAVMIEADESKCSKIKSNYPTENVYPICAWLGFTKGVDTLDHYLQTTPIPKDFDLLSIDVDGMDFHLWKSLEQYRPRIVCIEFNHLVPNDVVFIQDCDNNVNEGHSLAALIEMAKDRDYELVGVVHRNAYFVVKEEFHKFQPEITDNSIDAIRPFYPAYIWSTYNGKIYHTMPRVRWPTEAKAFDLKPDSIQLFRDFYWRDSIQGAAAPQLATRRTPGGPNKGATAETPVPSAQSVVAGQSSTAEELLKQLLELRQGRAELPAETRKTRQKELWSAVKGYFDQDANRGRERKNKKKASAEAPPLAAE